eukprot:TRINITY_DN35107_c0_g1_i1.p1 TRINITY_DN35107_c0_g1~~TRINITY_DN35107_c0_g1_i1.p1  ORF type:complete len:133 (+),score=10.17 TRINITY_DN35107_c0_g1_i1:282-680(+)
MRMKGTLRRYPVVVLIDSGITRSFLDPNVAWKVGLVVQGSGMMEVMVANGERLSSKGKCVDVTLTIQGLIVTAVFFLLPLGGCDVVLGAHWLRSSYLRPNFVGHLQSLDEVHAAWDSISLKRGICQRSWCVG